MTDSPFKLDFLIPGVQKMGTTALSQYLTQHPDICMPEQEELHFFRRHLRADGHSQDDPERLRPLSAYGNKHALEGKATPKYLNWRFALDLIKDHTPDIRLIISLRNPIERAYSAWSMEYRRGRESMSFSDAIRAGQKRDHDESFGVRRIFSYMERGFYAQQLSEVFDRFARDQKKNIKSDTIGTFTKVLDELTDFLGLKAYTCAPIIENVFRSSLEKGPPQLREDFAYLHSLYIRDLISLQKMLPFDISDWIDSPPQRRSWERVISPRMSL